MRYDVGLAAKIFAGLALLLIAIGIALGAFGLGRVAPGFMVGLRLGVIYAGPAIAAMVAAGLTYLLTKSAAASWVLSALVLLAGVSWLFWGIFEALSLIGTG